VIALLLLACGYDEKAFYADFSEASCEWIAACGSLEAYGYADAKECARAVHYGDLMASCRDIAADPADCECVDFDADAARACVETWSAAAEQCMPIEEIHCDGVCAGDLGAAFGSVTLGG
jgi:hypothetical protein